MPAPFVICILEFTMMRMGGDDPDIGKLSKLSLDYERVERIIDVMMLPFLTRLLDPGVRRRQLNPAAARAERVRFVDSASVDLIRSFRGSQRRTPARGRGP